MPTPPPPPAPKGNKYAAGNPGGGRPTKYGRPAKYDPEKFNAQVRDAMLLGLTDAQLAGFLGVNEQTINKWKKKVPDFNQAQKEGKAIADANVAKSLYARARGYAHEVTKVFVIDGQIVEHKVVERYAPDVAACIIWLKNRQSQTWRDRIQVEHDVDDGLIKELGDAIRQSPTGPEPLGLNADAAGAVKPNGHVNGTGGTNGSAA